MTFRNIFAAMGVSRLASVVAILATPIALAPQVILAQIVSSDCAHDLGATTTVPLPAVPRAARDLTQAGEWTDNSAATRIGLMANSVLFHGANVQDFDAPVLLTLGVPAARVHFDVNVGQAGNTAGSGVAGFSGFCNLAITTAGLAPGSRGQLTFDTLDATAIFEPHIAYGSAPPVTPQSNPARVYSLNVLSLTDTDLVLDGIGLQFFDPRQGGQESEALISLDNASIDASGARSFGTIASADAPGPLRIIPTGNATTTNRLRLGGAGRHSRRRGRSTLISSTLRPLKCTTRGRSAARPVPCPVTSI